MPTLNIGGRDLDVRACTLADLKYKVRPFQDEIGKVASVAEAGEKVVGILVQFVGHNEGITVQWLEEQLPVSALHNGDLLSHFYEAIGLKPKEKAADPGEAKSQ